MSTAPNKFTRWSLETSARVWPWVGGAVLLLALGGLYYFLVSIQPNKVEQSEVIEGRETMTAAQRRRSDDIGQSERAYRRQVETGDVSEAAVAELEKAIEQQRQLLQENPRSGIEQSVRLDRLVSALDTLRAKEKSRRIVELQDGIEADRKEGHAAAALEKLQTALQLQREIDNSNAEARAKNFVREMSLLQAIETAEAEPLAQAFTAAMAQAKNAAQEQRWSDALTALGRARDAQTKINQDYPRTRFRNLTVLGEIESEIASLNAGGLAAEIDAREKGADAAADLGRAEEAAGFYKAAQDLQAKLNVEFARSRFVSAARIDQLEIKRQTVLAAEMLAAASTLDQGAAEALRHRQVVAAAKKVHDAMRLLTTVEKDFPKSRGLDGALKLKLSFLEFRGPELRALQDRLYDLLLPLPEAKDVLMARTEVPQDLYAKIMSGNPSRNAGMAFPVDSVSWLDTQEFCRRASWVLGAPIRLPTEREFRVALGDGDRLGWSADSAGGHSRETGQQPASDAGFCDLIGNVGEWLEPGNPDAVQAPVAGGSYLDGAAELQKVLIVSVDKKERARHIGFRVVADVRLE